MNWTHVSPKVSWDDNLLWIVGKVNWNTLVVYSSCVWLDLVFYDFMNYCVFYYYCLLSPLMLQCMKQEKQWRKAWPVSMLLPFLLPVCMLSLCMAVHKVTSPPFPCCPHLMEVDITQTVMAVTTMVLAQVTIQQLFIAAVLILTMIWTWVNVTFIMP